MTFTQLNYVNVQQPLLPRHLWGQLTMAEGGTKADFRPVGLVMWSEYLTKLSSEAKKRFESKILSAGLDIDPYVIEEWTQNPEDIPKVWWSDVVLYMVSTPSPYTKEAVKVIQTIVIMLQIYLT